MKRIFISFAVEDEKLRDFLRGQSRNENCPFEFIDMAVKHPWDSMWKTNSRTRIKGCDGVIAIVTKHTPQADGQLWEIRCAVEEGIPTIGIYGNNDHTGIYVPASCGYIRLVDWTWLNISHWINEL